MSKLSQLHVELSEQASDLGFRSIEEAETHGYTVKYSGNEAFLAPDIDKAYKETHEAWLEERASVLADLKELRSGFAEGGYHDEMDALDRAIAFVKEAHD